MDEIEDRFLVTSKIGIANTLRSMARQNVMLHVSKVGTDAGMISAVLDVDIKRGVFILDYTSDRMFNQHLTRPGNIHFSASADGVRILFSLDKPAKPTEFDGRPAFELVIPDSINRIQRREHFRIDIPISSPVAVVTQNHAESVVSFRIKDISAGGLALYDNDNNLPNAEVDKKYSGCKLQLEDLGSISTDLIVRRVSSIGDNPSKKIKVVACEFSNLSNQDQIIIQNFIGKLERQQNARRRGFE